MHLSKEELQEMRQMDIRDVRLDTLVDIRSIEIDRMKQYIKKVAEIKY